MTEKKYNEEKIRRVVAAAADLQDAGYMYLRRPAGQGDSIDEVIGRLMACLQALEADSAA